MAETDWVAASRKSVERARRDIKQAVARSELGTMGGFGERIIAEIWSVVQDSLDDIDQTIPPEEDDDA
jgi:hypothetical protein